ncbi:MULTISPECIES: LysE family translocator [unclassified Halomonas]|uniref:LysE family translocator n=1 Tax=unclassified Halomonas TaxID=2609666 RepID=UPI0007D9F34A|nr:MULTISPECIES: LysE family translocator [unclassified Halomonas]MBT2786199.1 LysE family translocator [Halomonas sp. ISL-106]MBT2797221.1 LysE family translocator [Halomonas sp. ISL-104]OAL58597.1 lysine transporter LysE [Halomonas sp. ALS9]
MLLSTWLLFVAVAMVSIASPGPAFLVAVRNGITGGTKRVALSSLGNITGLLILASAAVLGLGVVLNASEVLFSLLKLGGAAYLIYLGIRQWRSRTSLAISTIAAKPTPRWRTFSEGALVAVSNPKAILFFTALFPQFLDTQRALLPQFSLMVGTFMALSFAVLMIYGGLAKHLSRWLSSASRVKWVNRMMGSAFIGLGISILRLRQPV